MKLAFLFLTRDNHNQGDVWEAFFRSQPHRRYSVYCHPKYPEKTSQPFLMNSIIPERIATEHADISLVRATLLLIKYALADPENEILILLSDSCIPLYGFNQIQSFLARNDRSLISFEQNTGNRETAMRWGQLMDTSFIAADRFAKQHQWMALRRKLAQQILQSDHTGLFEKMYAPDEHYFINLLIRLNLPLETLVANRMITFVNWRDCETETVERRDPERGKIILRRIHPKTYGQIGSADIVAARRLGCLFFRKVSSACDCSSLIRLIPYILVYDRAEAVRIIPPTGSEQMRREANAISIAVLSRDKEEEKIIHEAKISVSANFIYVPTMQHLNSLLMEQSCNGVLLCLKSLVGIDQSSRSFVQTLEHVYPVARVRWNKAKGFLGLIASRGGRIESLSDFMTICANFTPRRLRRSERLIKTLNVLISAAPDLADASHAFTMNVSVRGCFLHTPREWPVGGSVYMRILELPGKSVVEGKVIRCVQWGVPFSVQGIGIQFINTEHDQIEELRRLLYDLPSLPPNEIQAR